MGLLIETVGFIYVWLGAAPTLSFLFSFLRGIETSERSHEDCFGANVQNWPTRMYEDREGTDLSPTV